MLEEEAIQEQLTLLRAHRRTLAHYLEQRALHGKAYEPPAVAHGIIEAREQIEHIKMLLRENGVTVEDEPNDLSEATTRRKTPPTLVERLIAALGISREKQRPVTPAETQPSLTPTHTAIHSTTAPVSHVISRTNVRDVVQLSRLGKGVINDISLSPDGRAVVIASSLGIYLHDSKTLNEIHFIDTNKSVYSAVFSPVNGIIASISMDKTVEFWDVTTSKLLRTSEEYADGIRCVTYSPDGNLMALTSGRMIYLQEESSGQIRYTLEGNERLVTRIAFNQDGRTLASAGTDNITRLWDINTGKLLHLLKEHTSSVTDIALSADGGTLASSSLDNTTRIWDTSTGTLLQTIEVPNYNADGIAFSPDSQLLALASINSVQLRNVSTGKLLQTLDGHTDRLRRIIFSPDGQTLITAGRDGNICIWNTKAGNLERIGDGFTSGVQSIAFSSDGHTLVSGGGRANGRLEVWDAISRNHLRTLVSHTGCVGSVVFSPDGQMLASGASDGTIQLWDTSTGQMLNSFRSNTQYISSVTFSPDGHFIASGGGANWGSPAGVQLWDVSTLLLLHTLEGHKLKVNSIAFSPDGRTLAYASWDRTVRLWDISTSEQLLILTLEGYSSGAASIAFSPTGQLLASAVSTVSLWDVKSGELVRKYTNHRGNVNALAFSPNGHLLVIAADNTIQFLDANNGNFLRLLEEHRDMVTSIAFSPDGRLLASGSADGTVRLWGIQVSGTFSQI
jgi:WD40 repeat protein